MDALMAPGAAPMRTGTAEPLPAQYKRITTTADKRALAMEHTPLSAHPLDATNYRPALPETERSPTRRKAGGRVSQLSGDSLQFSEGPQDSARETSIFSILSDDSPEVAGTGRNISLYGTNFSEDFFSMASESPRESLRSSVRPAPPMQPRRPPFAQRAPVAHSQAAQSRYYGEPLQMQEMDKFFSSAANAKVAPPQSAPRILQKQRTLSSDYSKEDSDSELFDDDLSFDESATLCERITALLDPTAWLCRNAKYDADGMPFFDDYAVWTLSGFARHYLFNPFSPEFTSLQQFCWAVILGVVMGFYTAAWKWIIENGLEFMWKTVPETLLSIGLFTDLNGVFPLYHYMWMCPSLFGGVLSYIFASLTIPIPGQNEWIDNVHSRGVQDYRTFFSLFCLSTLGMLSGLSLGPELPLVLTAGMVGSWLSLACKQSMLQARVMNLTAASAAVGGFFGFPMAGALFVLEIPHRAGLQYFEVRIYVRSSHKASTYRIAP